MTTPQTARFAAAFAALGLLAPTSFAQEGKVVESAEVKVIDAKVVKAGQGKSKVDAADVERRLKMRTPKFRKVKLFDAKDAPAVPQPVVETKKSKVRLFGDAERKDLAATVVLTVDGAPVHEAEVMEMAKYFASYEGGTPDTHIARAMQEYIRVRVIEACIGKEQVAKLRKSIDALRAKAAADGADFAAIAKGNSHCPSKEQGGSLGQFGRQSMVAPFAQFAFTTPVGKVSPVFATNFGYHFLKVTGKQKGKTRAEDQVAASHVLMMFDQDQNKVAECAQRIDTGKAEIAVRDDSWRKKMPANLR